MKTIKLITKKNEFVFPIIFFNESNMLNKYFEDYDILDWSEYNNEIIDEFFKYFNCYHKFSHEINEIDNTELLNDLLLFCDKFGFIDIYKIIFNKNKKFIEDNIVNFLPNLNYEIELDYCRVNIEHITNDKIFKLLFKHDFYNVLYYFRNVDCNEKLFLEKFENYLKNNEMKMQLIGFDKKMYIFRSDLKNNTINDIFNKLTKQNNKIIFESLHEYVLNIDKKLKNIIAHKRNSIIVSNYFWNDRLYKIQDDDIKSEFINNITDYYSDRYIGVEYINDDYVLEYEYFINFIKDNY